MTKDRIRVQKYLVSEKDGLLYELIYSDIGESRSQISLTYRLMGVKMDGYVKMRVADLLKRVELL